MHLHAYHVLDMELSLQTLNIVLAELGIQYKYGRSLLDR